MAELKEQMEYLRLEEPGAPEWEREQGRADRRRVPTLELAPPTETFTGERDLGDAVADRVGAAHTASDAIVWFPGRARAVRRRPGRRARHLNLTRGFPPENWLAVPRPHGRARAVHVVPGHGGRPARRRSPPAGEYVETVVELAATPGDHEIPRALRGLDVPEGFAQNIEALRAR